MTEPLPSPHLGESAARIFRQIRTHKAMPLLEIAAVTDIRGDDLTHAVEDLERQNLVTVKGSDPLEMIVSVSGRYY